MEKELKTYETMINVMSEEVRARVCPFSCRFAALGPEHEQLPAQCCRRL